MNFLSKLTLSFLTILLSSLLPQITMAAEGSSGPTSLDMITSPAAIFCIIIFIVAYAFVMAEEFTHFRKSKPVILAATLIYL